MKTTKLAHLSLMLYSRPESACDLLNAHMNTMRPVDLNIHTRKSVKYFMVYNSSLAKCTISCNIYEDLFFGIFLYFYSILYKFFFKFTKF